MGDKEAYIRGLIDGVTRYAWWRGGTQYVGSCGTTLKAAVEDILKEHGLRDAPPVARDA